MTSRQRIIAAINHRQPDCTPLDLGACGQTGISASTVYKLRQGYNLASHPIKIVEPYQMLGEIEDDLLKRVGGDVLPLYNPVNLMGTSNNITKPWQMPDGTPVLMSDNFEFDKDDNENIYVYPCGDRNAKYSLHLPSGGSFFDNINRTPKIDEANLTPLEDFAQSYTLHTEETCKYWEKHSKDMYENTQYAILGILGGMGLGDAAELPGPFLKEPRGIRKMEDWLMAHYLFPEYIKSVFEYQTSIMLKNLELYRQSVGERIQIVWLSGTDFGTQSSLFLSAEMFREFYKPFYKKVNDWVHKNTDWKTFYHSCGTIYELLDDFIEMGVDIINPVQCSAKGMDPQKLKSNFGQKLTFWGAGINTQQTLPYGSTNEVEEEVTARLKIFSNGGGFVFSSIHNVVSNVPVENLIAMYYAIEKFRRKEVKK